MDVSFLDSLSYYFYYFSSSSFSGEKENFHFLINHFVEFFKCVFKRSKDRHITNMIKVNTYMKGDKGEIRTKSA